ncbi:putative PEP-binding protein, partial [Rhizobium ruizarguesonis]
LGQAAGVVALADNGDAVIIDSDEGHVHLRPMADHRRSYEEKFRFRARRQEQFRALRAVEPVTKAGRRIALMMNAGLLVDLPQLSDSGAEGIGLFRTE